MFDRLADHLQVSALKLRGFRQHHIATSVGRVHAVASEGKGEGPPIVVLHGIAASCGHFWEVLPGLRRVSRRVIAADMPGHGFSEVPQGGLVASTLTTGLAEGLNGLCNEPFLLVGNSLGGLAAIRYASNFPDRVKGLYLLSPGGAPMDEAGLQSLLEVFKMDSWAKARAFVPRLYARVPWFAQAIAPVVKATFSRPALRALVDSVKPADLLTPSEVSGLKVPTRLVWGKYDSLLPRENLAFFRAHLPAHAQVEEPELFGHCPTWIGPES